MLHPGDMEFRASHDRETRAGIKAIRIARCSGLLRSRPARDGAYLSISRGKPEGNLRANCSGNAVGTVSPPVTLRLAVNDAYAVRKRK